MSSAPAPAAAPKAPAPAPAAAAAAAAAAPKAKPAKKTVKKATGAGTTAKPKKKTARRKKPAASRNAISAANAQNIWNAASLAQSELAQQSAHAAALRSDPLWYRTNEPLESISQDSFMVSGGTGVLSDQVEIVEAALSNNNMTRADVTPQAFACLLEQARRYALELLAEAQDYAYSANRHEVTRPDLVLAQELRADQPMADFTQQPRLAQLAQTVNQKPLPPIPTTNYTGVVLPSKQHLLTARTFDVVTGARVAQRMVAPTPTPASSNKTTAKAPSTQQPSYGASRGRQIPIKISQSSTPAAIAAAAPGGTPSNAPAPTAPAPAAPVPATGTMPAPAPAAGAPSAPTPAVGVPPPSTGTATTKRKADQM